MEFSLLALACTLLPRLSPWEVNKCREHLSDWLWQLFSNTFFSKIYLFLLKSQIYREKEKKRGRSSSPWFTSHVTITASAVPIQSHRTGTSLGLSCGCRVPRQWADYDWFPRPQAGSWMGSGATGLEPATKWHPSTFMIRTLDTRPPRRTVIFSLK